LTGVVTVAMVRNSTTITSTITENASNQAYATSSGGATLVPTWSMVNWTTNNTVTLRLSANSSLTPTIMKIGYVITNYHSTSTATLTQL
jgi:peptidoglycan hydrolase-like amidase